MPIHYGSRELHFQTVSSPLATQLSHAAGAAYALKREGSDRIVVCFFGEGAASEGDFHAAMNFAATLKCPVMFICRNNGYAISTSVKDQYSGDGIAGRGIGYGIRTTRVDGLDVHAVFDAVSEGRRVCREHNEPVLIECMSYRAGHHSTSDDSLKYRPKEELQYWNERNPIDRLRLCLERKGLWDSHQESTLRETKRRELRLALSEASERRRPPINQMFQDVYKDIPAHLLEQSQDMMEHIQLHPKEYKPEEFS
jgi:2-oxoisovalerate dehydrogenase E1 component alpha subunit